MCAPSRGRPVSLVEALERAEAPRQQKLRPLAAYLLHAGMLTEVLLAAGCDMFAPAEQALLLATMEDIMLSHPTRPGWPLDDDGGYYSSDEEEDAASSFVRSSPSPVHSSRSPRRLQFGGDSEGSDGAARPSPPVKRGAFSDEEAHALAGGFPVLAAAARIQAHWRRLTARRRFMSARGALKQLAIAVRDCDEEGLPSALASAKAELPPGAATPSLILHGQRLAEQLARMRQLVEAHSAEARPADSFTACALLCSAASTRDLLLRQLHAQTAAPSAVSLFNAVGSPQFATAALAVGISRSQASLLCRQLLGGGQLLGLLRAAGLNQPMAVADWLAAVDAACHSRLRSDCDGVVLPAKLARDREPVLRRPAARWAALHSAADDVQHGNGRVDGDELVNSHKWQRAAKLMQACLRRFRARRRFLAARHCLFLLRAECAKMQTALAKPLPALGCVNELPLLRAALHDCDATQLHSALQRARVALPFGGRSVDVVDEADDLLLQAGAVKEDVEMRVAQLRMPRICGLQHSCWLHSSRRPLRRRVLTAMFGGAAGDGGAMDGALPAATLRAFLRRTAQLDEEGLQPVSELAVRFSALLVGQQTLDGHLAEMAASDGHLSLDDFVELAEDALCELPPPYESLPWSDDEAADSEERSPPVVLRGFQTSKGAALPDGEGRQRAASLSDAAAEELVSSHRWQRAATALQAGVRAWLARLEEGRRRDWLDGLAAAGKLQAVCRGWLVRSRVAACKQALDWLEAALRAPSQARLAAALRAAEPQLDGSILHDAGQKKLGEVRAKLQQLRQQEQQRREDAACTMQRFMRAAVNASRYSAALPLLRRVRAAREGAAGSDELQAVLLQCERELPPEFGQLDVMLEAEEALRAARAEQAAEEEAAARRRLLAADGADDEVAAVGLEDVHMQEASAGTGGSRASSPASDAGSAGSAGSSGSSVERELHQAQLAWLRSLRMFVDSKADVDDGDAAAAVAGAAGAEAATHGLLRYIDDAEAKVREAEKVAKADGRTPLPKFIRRRVPRAKLLQQAMRRAAREVHLRRRSTRLMSERELQRLANVLRRTFSPPVDVGDDVPRLNYADYNAIKRKLPPRAAAFVTPAAFVKFRRDEHGRISSSAFFNYVSRKATLMRTRLLLSMYDAGGKGQLTELDLQLFVLHVMEDLPCMATVASDLRVYYAITVARQLLFAVDRDGNGYASVKALLASPLLEQLQALREDMPAEKLAAMRFAPPHVLRLLQAFVQLDADKDGLLGAAELALFDGGSLNPAVVRRLFQCSTLLDGELDFLAFLDLSLSLESLGSPRSMAYFWRLLDASGSGALDSRALMLVGKEAVEAAGDRCGQPFGLRDLKRVLHALAPPADGVAVTLADLLAAEHGKTALTLLIDVPTLQDVLQRFCTK
eukprot:PLAT3637.5.p1 GENE.PLAT3637.5~~PLAT3637.5.p1  ORF type:complete len:1578 (-),score=842.47 PLAT3637.5:1787-5998(-)